MNTTFTKSLLLAGLSTFITQTAFAEGSPWLAEPGATTVSLTQVHQTSDEIKKLPVDIKLHQNTTWLALNHGINDALAFDLKVGYAASREEYGRADSSLGLSWRVLDEFIEDDLPTVTLRAGATIAGDYDIGSPHAIGDGANGGDISVLVGKILQPWLAASADLGFRKRTSGVPDEIFYSLGVHILPIENLSSSLTYRFTNARDGLDVGGPGFDGTNFNRLEEDTELLDLSASYQLTSAVNLGLNLARVTDGKNAANNNIYAATIGYAF